MLFTNLEYAIFDELELLQQVYLQNDQPSFRPKETFYDIQTPFLMDSQLKKWQEGGSGKRKRRKSAHVQRDAPEFLAKNAGVVRGIYEQFCKTIESDGLREQFFCQRSPSDSRSNEEARQCVRSAPASLPQRANSSTTLRIVRLDSSEQKFSAEQKECAVIYRNASNRVVLAGSTICPRNSAFLLGDVRLARHLMGVGLDKFDFIVMDPPWPNRTVKRQKTYETFNRDFSANNPIEGMRALQIGELLSPEGLVAIWLSNSETAHRTAELMLERWKLRRVAQWHWLKVCKSADPVCEFRPEHKVPFESVLLACKADAKEQGGGFDSIKEAQSFGLSIRWNWPMMQWTAAAQRTLQCPQQEEGVDSQFCRLAPPVHRPKWAFGIYFGATNWIIALTCGRKSPPE